MVFPGSEFEMRVALKKGISPKELARALEHYNMHIVCGEKEINIKVNYVNVTPITNSLTLQKNNIMINADKLTLSLSERATVSGTLYGINGMKIATVANNMVMKSSTAQITIPALNQLSKGTYLLRLKIRGVSGVSYIEKKLQIMR